MLNRLTIDNYALIDKSVVDFQEGFTVITGETGAGKSIMLDALGLLMGARADAKTMGSKNRKTIVEAIFSKPKKELKEIIEENGIEWDEEELILRREILPSGKSRGFVNDSPVNLSILSAVSDNLIDIHSQHSNSLLNKPRQQLEIIDCFGHHENLLEEYKNSFKNYVNLRNRIKQIKNAIEKGKENEEFIRFRLEQLDKLKPKRGELANLEREAEILGDADRIKSKLTEATSLLGHGNESALRMLQSATAELEGVDFELMDPQEKDNIEERLNSLKIELRDITDTLEGYSDSINSNPERLEKIRNRIETLYEVMKRFKVKDEEELVSLHERLKEELSALTGEDKDIRELERNLKELAKDLKEKAEKLSEAREESSKKFSERLVEEISPLGLPNIKFIIETQRGKMASDGQDSIVFYCSFNKNHPIQPVSDIASGGEISRVMLGIKSVMADRMELPTIIFDEIDTGVSGEIAFKMGHMMKSMSGKLQVISVTHLPQVAAHGNTHLKVYKADDNEKTVSHIRKLDMTEREREIAGMLSGSSINDVSLENARGLLKSV